MKIGLLARKDKGNKGNGESKNLHLHFNDMTLDEFEKVNMTLKINSSVLDETVCFASNDEVAEKLKNEGFTIYTADELKVVAKRKPRPEELRVIHEIKNVFLGSKVIQ